MRVTIPLSLALSALIFGSLVTAQTWVLGENPGTGRLLASVVGWMAFCVLTACFAVGIGYSFDVTDGPRLKRIFVRANLITTGVLALWLAVALTSDAPPPFLGEEPPDMSP